MQMNGRKWIQKVDPKHVTGIFMKTSGNCARLWKKKQTNKLKEKNA